MKKAPNKIGRPTKYKPEYCDLLIKHMKDGLSFESFGGIVGVWKEALYNWLKKHKDFANAKKLGTAYSLLWWEGVGCAGATGTLTRVRKKTVYKDGREEYEYESSNFNAASYIFNMKNRFGWRNENNIKIDSNVKGEIQNDIKIEFINAD